jgi:hypothetical protein
MPTARGPTSAPGAGQSRSRLKPTFWRPRVSAVPGRETKAGEKRSDGVVAPAVCAARGGF